MTLYLPFFYDRTASWGKIGCIYNRLLGTFGLLYKNIITINRIQAKLIRRFMHRATIVIPNRVNDVPRAEKAWVRSSTLHRPVGSSDAYRSFFAGWTFQITRTARFSLSATDQSVTWSRA